MKKKMGFLAVLLALVMCVSLMAGCSGTNTNTAADDTARPDDGDMEDVQDTGTDGAAAEAEDESLEAAPDSMEEFEEMYITVGEVKAISDDGTVTISDYELAASAVDYKITDFASVNLDNYIDTSAQETIALELYTIQEAVDGTLTEADSSVINVGDMLVLYTDESGNYAIAVYHVIDETETESPAAVG